MDEFNFVAEWTPDKHWYIAGAGAYGLPGAAAKQIFGNDRNYLLFQSNIVYTF